MKKLDLYSSLFWFILCIPVSLHSMTLGLGTLRRPGPGFLFFWCAVIMGLLSAGVFVSAAIPRKGSRVESEEKAFRNVKWKNVIYVLFSITLYGIIFERIGYVLSTFFLISFLLYAIGAKRWYLVLLIACASSVLSYVLFALWLDVRLPRGVLWI